jgi:hypothetical protein
MTAQFKRAKQYSVTLGPVFFYESIREDTVGYFEDLETYCVSVEGLCSNSVVHMHLYLKFKCLCTCNDVRAVLEWFPGTINVQVCRSEKSWLKYITKEDATPYFNCKLSSLSFYTRAMD